MSEPVKAVSIEDAERLTLRRSLGPNAFLAHVTGPRELLDEMTDAFGDLPAFSDRERSRAVRVSVEADRRIDGRQFFQITFDDADPWRVAHPRAAVDHIVTSLTRLALDESRGRLHLHAGLVATDDGAMLFTGPSGAGKSTLVAAAVRSGESSYVTDEMISIDLATAEVYGLIKPLTFKRATWELHQDLLGPAPSDGERWSVRASRLGQVANSGPHKVGMIVFPQHTEEVELSIASMHPTRALVRLVSETLDMERAGPKSFHQMAEVVARSACLEVRYRSSTHAFNELRDHLRSQSEPAESRPTLMSLPLPADISSVPPSTPNAVHSHRTATTVSFVLNGRAALYNWDSGIAADLDEVATMWWLELDGRHSVAEIAQRFADVSKGASHEIENAGNRMIRELVDAGFVA